jgi:hypothetical protein
MEVSGNFISQPLQPWGKNLWYSLDRRLGGPQSSYGCGGEEKDLLPCQELNSDPCHPAHG